MASSAARMVIVTDARDDDALIDLLEAGLADLMARRGAAGWVRRDRRALPFPAGAGAPPRVIELIGGNAVADETGLTTRQRDVLRLVARGQSNKEIARDLGVSPATVKTHVAQLIAILGATNRTDAAMKARGRGLL